MLDWSTKDSITKVAFLLAFIEKFHQIDTGRHKKQCQISFATHLFFKPLGGGFSWPICNGNSCLPPLENSMPCTAWVSLGGPIQQPWKVLHCFLTPALQMSLSTYLSNETLHAYAFLKLHFHRDDRVQYTFCR